MNAQAGRLAGATAVPDAARRSPAKLQALLTIPGSQVILIDTSRDPNSGATVVLIPPGSSEPGLVVKIATTAAAAEVVAREARILVALQQRSLRRVAETVPRHQGMYDADGMLAGAATVVPGAPMSTGYHAFRHLSRPGRVRADFTAAANWLTVLHTDSGAGPAPISLLDGLAERIADRWPGDTHARQLGNMLPALAARLQCATTQRTIVHGDFWPGNLLMSGGVITGVVDWAAGELNGEPLRDVARFAVSYSLYLDRHTRPGRRILGHPGLRADHWGSGIQYAMAGQHWYGQLVRSFVGTSLTRLGAPATLWREVLLAGLAEVAATADHPGFAARHRDLLRELIPGILP